MLSQSGSELPYGISQAHQNLYNAYHGMNAEGNVDQAIQQFLESSSFRGRAREQFLRDIANPALEETWGKYTKLIQEISEEDDQGDRPLKQSALERVRQLFEEVHCIKTCDEKVIAMCRQYGVPVSTYVNIVQYTQKIAEGGTLDAQAPLVLAALQKNYMLFEMLYAFHPELLRANINRSGSNGMTPMMIASSLGDAKMITLLHRLGADVNQSGNNGKTPLIVAVERSKKEIVTLLYECGAYLDKPNQYGQTPIGIAERKGNVEMMELLEHLRPQRSYKITAAYQELYDIQQTKLNSLSKKQRMDKAIEWMIGDVHEHREEWLKDADNPKLRETWEKYKQLIEQFPQQGEQNILKIASIRIQQLFDEAEVLKKYGIAPSAYIDFVHYISNREGTVAAETPFIRALKDNYEDLMRVTQELRPEILRANVDKLDRHGMTPLMVAAKEKNVEMARLLCDLGADVNQPGRRGDTPMMIAATEDAREIVTLLYDFGANLNQSNTLGITPMARAARKDNAEMMELLYDLYARDAELGAGQPLNLNQTITVKTGSMKSHVPLLSAVVIENKPRAAELLRIWGADQEYSEEVIRRIFLAHVWGIGNTTSSLTDSSGENTAHFLLEGLTGSYAMHMLTQYVDDFFAQNIREKRSNIPAKGIIYDSIKNALPLSSDSDEQIVHKIHLGEPVVIAGGWRDHAISIVIQGDQVGICNRGGGRGERAIEFYALPESGINEDIVKALKTKYPNTDSYYHMIESLGLHNRGGVDQRKQKVGNCAWAAAKGVFWMLCMLYTDDRARREVYKEFTAFAREKALEDYLNQSTQPDLELLRKIREKYDQKAGLFLPQYLLDRLL